MGHKVTEATRCLELKHLQEEEKSGYSDTTALPILAYLRNIDISANVS